jgi:hypothetical protein
VCIVRSDGARCSHDPLRLPLFADRQIDERRASAPPVTRVAELTGPSSAVNVTLRACTCASLLGPVPLEETPDRRDVRSFIVVDRKHAGALTAELAAAIRTASTEEGPGREVRVRMDPRDM